MTSTDTAKRYFGTLIGYCYRDSMRVETHVALFETWLYDRADRKLLRGETRFCGLYVDQNRDQLCRNFLSTDAEWLLMVDLDECWKPDSLYRLLDAAETVDAKVISALYFGYTGNDDVPSPIPLWWTETGHVVEFVDGEKPQKIGSCGAGFLLIHRSALEAFPEREGWRWFGRDVKNGEPMGEDITFCHRCHELGIDIWGFGGVIIDHFKTRKINLRTYMADSPVP